MQIGASIFLEDLPREAEHQHRRILSPCLIEGNQRIEELVPSFAALYSDDEAPGLLVAARRRPPRGFEQLCYHFRRYGPFGLIRSWAPTACEQFMNRVVCGGGLCQKFGSAGRHDHNSSFQTVSYVDGCDRC